MEHGFSATPHHGLELSGGAPAADAGIDPPTVTGTADAIPTARTTNGFVNEQTGESEHVIPVTI